MSNRTAFALVPFLQPGHRIVMLTFRESDYNPTDYDSNGMSEDDCQQLVNALNDELGVPATVAAAMLAGSMFGWHVPGAAAAIVHFSLLG